MDSLQRILSLQFVKVCTDCDHRNVVLSREVLAANETVPQHTGGNLCPAYRGEGPFRGVVGHEGKYASTDQGLERVTKD